MCACLCVRACLCVFVRVCACVFVRERESGVTLVDPRVVWESMLEALESPECGAMAREERGACGLALAGQATSPPASCSSTRLRDEIGERPRELRRY